MKRLAALTVAGALLLSGCGAEPKVSEQVIVTGIGIAEQDGVWTLAIQAVESLKTAGSLSEQSETATAVYTASGGSVAEALQAFLNETGKRAYILQNQILVLSDTLCRSRSLYTVLDYFIRNREGRALADVVMCRGDPAAVLDIAVGSDAIPAVYVSQLLEEGARLGSAAVTQLPDIQRASAGMYDSVLPLLSVTDGVPRLDGTVLFRDGISVGVMNSEETRGLLLAQGTVQQCLYTADGITLRLEDIQSHLTTHRTDNGWRYHISVSATAQVVETDRSVSAERCQLAREQIRVAIAEDIQAAFTRVRESDSDPLALARRTATQHRMSQQTVAATLPQAVCTVTVTLQ